MVRSLSLAQQSTILSLLDTGLSGEAIARQTGVSPSAISKLRSMERSALPKAIVYGQLYFTFIEYEPLSGII